MSGPGCFLVNLESEACGITRPALLNPADTGFLLFQEALKGIKTFIPVRVCAFWVAAVQQEGGIQVTLDHMPGYFLHPLA